MPYASKGDVPPAVRNALTDHGIDIWRKAWNAAYEQYDHDESKAYAVAWAAARKAGELKTKK